MVMADYESDYPELKYSYVRPVGYHSYRYYVEDPDNLYSCKKCRKAHHAGTGLGIVMIIALVFLCIRAFVIMTCSSAAAQMQTVTLLCDTKLNIMWRALVAIEATLVFALYLTFGLRALEAVDTLSDDSETTDTTSIPSWGGLLLLAYLLFQAKQFYDYHVIHKQATQHDAVKTATTQ